MRCLQPRSSLPRGAAGRAPHASSNPRLVGRSSAVVSVDGARVHLLGDHAPQPPSPAPAPARLSLLDAATQAATEANVAAAAAAVGAGEATAAAEAHTGEAHTGEAYTGLRLSGADQAMLDGAHGRAAQVAIWGDIGRCSEM